MKKIYHKQITSDDSADENQCIEYITWFIDNFTCRHYMIVFLGHGTGVDQTSSDSNPQTKGKTWMSGRILGKKLRELKKKRSFKLDLLFLQQCGRGSIENLYSFRETAEYILTSPVRIGTPNTYYTFFHRWLELHPKVTGNKIAETIAKNDKDYKIYSCIRTQKLEDLPGRLNTFLKPIVDKKDRIAFKNPLIIVYKAVNKEILGDAESLIKNLGQSCNIDNKETSSFITWLQRELLVKVWFSDKASEFEKTFSGLTLFLPKSSKQLEKHKELDLYKNTLLPKVWKKIHQKP